MTDDIVARLRDWEIHSTGRNPANAPFAEAADKIERLRAALYSLNADLDGIGEAYTPAVVETMRKTIEAALAEEKGCD